MSAMENKQKSAKEHYTNLFEGLRLVGCSSVMLAVCGIKWTAAKIRELRRNGRKEQIVDAEIVEPEDAN